MDGTQRTHNTEDRGHTPTREQTPADPRTNGRSADTYGEEHGRLGTGAFRWPRAVALGRTVGTAGAISSGSASGLIRCTQRLRAEVSFPCTLPVPRKAG